MVLMHTGGMKKFCIRPNFIGSDLIIEAWNQKDAIERFGRSVRMLCVNLVEIEDDLAPEGAPKVTYTNFTLGNDTPFYVFEMEE